MTSHRSAGAGIALTAITLAAFPLVSCSEVEHADPAAEVTHAAALRATGSLASEERDNLAARLVLQSAQVREGDRVLISGGVRDIELLEDIAVQVRKAGAHPLVTLESDRMTRRMFDDVDARYDSQYPTMAVNLVEISDVFISVDASESEDLLAHVPAERIAARGEAALPVQEVFLKNAIRTVNLGNGLYPTAALANRFRIQQDQLAEMFWDGINIDYRELEARGRAVKEVLAAGREIHITSAEGTDLRVGIEGRPIFVSDGVISDEDRARGAAGSQVWLPAGEVYLVPVPGSATGTVVIPHFSFEGTEIENLTLTFAAGRMTGMTADSGLESLQLRYDAAGEGKDELGVIDFGINPNVRVPAGSRVLTWVADGMVTVMVGNNVWAGGTNSIAFGLPLHIVGGTVAVDGRPIVQNGVLEL